MDKGQIKQSGAARDVYASPRDPYVVEFLGGQNVFSGSVDAVPADWGAIFPDMVERILPFQGSAKCSRHNFAFLEGVKAALQADKAKAFVMPASTDLYFPPEDSAIEVEHMPNAELRVVETDRGHFAGGPGTSAADIKVLDAALKEPLAL